MVRQRSAKPLFIGSIPIAASNHPRSRFLLFRLLFHLWLIPLPKNEPKFERPRSSIQEKREMNSLKSTSPVRRCAVRDQLSSETLRATLAETGSYGTNPGELSECFELVRGLLVMIMKDLVMWCSIASGLLSGIDFFNTT